MPKKTDKIFNLEHQYQLYIQRVGLSEATMHPEQRKQLKMTFMGACGQFMTLLRDDLGALPEDDGVEVLASMEKQVLHYFVNIARPQN